VRRHVDAARHERDCQTRPKDRQIMRDRLGTDAPRDGRVCGGDRILVDDAARHGGQGDRKVRPVRDGPLRAVARRRVIARLPILGAAPSRGRRPYGAFPQLRLAAECAPEETEIPAAPVVIMKRTLADQRRTSRTVPSWMVTRDGPSGSQSTGRMPLITNRRGLRGGERATRPPRAVRCSPRHVAWARWLAEGSVMGGCSRLEGTLRLRGTTTEVEDPCVRVDDHL
jgi:hypothetical protein